METVKLELLTKENEEAFILMNQEAFNFGARQYFSEADLMDQEEANGEIISRETIISSIHHDNAYAYRILLNNVFVGVIVLTVKEDFGELELFFVDPKCHGKGVGQRAWKIIENLYPNVKIWETYTPSLKREIFTSISINSASKSSNILTNITVEKTILLT